MDKIEFNQLLKKANYTKKEFAKEFELSASAVNNWGGSAVVPIWVKPYLILYIKNKNCTDLKQILKENLLNDELI